MPTEPMPPDTAARPPDLCGCCEMRSADIVATVPMCGERPRYPMCMDCAAPLVECGYAEEVEVLADAP
jgi:hypothetical protein